MEEYQGVHRKKRSVRDGVETRDGIIMHDFGVWLNWSDGGIWTEAYDYGWRRFRAWNRGFCDSKC